MTAGLSSLDRLTREYRINAQHIHVLSGDPEMTLPEFAARHQYDAIALGGLTHRKGVSTLAGTLTSRLVDALDCDFILVKRSPLGAIEDVESISRPSLGEGSEHGPSVPASARSGSSVLWQSLFGD